jgi:Ca2+/Na+ antiporter
MERSLGQLLFSVVINLLVGLTPAVVLRYLIYGRPVGRWTAVLWTGGILVGLTALFFSIAPEQTNTGAIAIYALITYYLLYYGYEEKKGEGEGVN